MSSLSIWTADCCAPAGARTATVIAAIAIAAAVENRTCRRLILSSLQCPGLTCPFSNAMNAPHRLTAASVLEPGEQDVELRPIVLGARPCWHCSKDAPAPVGGPHSLLCRDIVGADHVAPKLDLELEQCTRAPGRQLVRRVLVHAALGKGLLRLRVGERSAQRAV